MKKYFLFILFCWANQCIAVPLKDNSGYQLQSPGPVKKIVKEIAKTNVYDFTANAAPTGTVSQQNSRYLELLQTANIEDLVKLATKHKNRVVRLYAYRAIVQKSKSVPPGILDQFTNDTTIVSTIRGGIKDKTAVNKIAASFLY